MLMYFSFDSFRSRLIKSLDIQPVSFDQGLFAWMKKHGSSDTAKNQYLLFIYDSLLDIIAKNAVNKEELYTRQRFIYGEIFAYKCFHDEDCTEVQRCMNYCDLQLAQHGIIKVQVSIQSWQCCPECDKMNGKTMSVENALYIQPLPNIHCTNKNGCTCSYTFHSVRDDNNKIVKNTLHDTGIRR
jgi:hypothetical protein